MKKIRIQNKPYPAGENYLLSSKPTSFCMLRSAVELSILGENISKNIHWEVRAKSKRFRNFLWDFIGRRLVIWVGRLRPMIFYKYKMNVRLNQEELQMLINNLTKLLEKNDRRN